MVVFSCGSLSVYVTACVCTSALACLLYSVKHLGLIKTEQFQHRLSPEVHPAVNEVFQHLRGHYTDRQWGRPHWSYSVYQCEHYVTFLQPQEQWHGGETCRIVACEKAKLGCAGPCGCCSMLLLPLWWGFFLPPCLRWHSFSSQHRRELWPNS